MNSKGTHGVMVCGFVLLATWSALADFSYPIGGSSWTGINLVGSAGPVVVGSESHMRLAKDSNVGAGWFLTRQAVANGFVSDFTFRYYGHGIVWNPMYSFAFVVQDSSSVAIGSQDAGMGYAGIPRSLAVEFDTWQDSSGDPNNNHISVQSRGTNANSANHAYSLGVSSAIPQLDPYAAKHHGKVVYTPGRLQVYFNNSDMFPDPWIDIAVDLESLLGLSDGRAYVGFTSDGGVGSGMYTDLMTWQFTVATKPPPTLVTAVSRKTHGSAGDFDVDLLHPLGANDVAVECRQGGLRHLILTFDRAIQGTGVQLQTTAGSPVTVVETSIDGPQLTLKLADAEPTARLTLTFPGITDLDGIAVVQQLCIGVLTADVTGDESTSRVNLSDMLTVRDTLNQIASIGNFRNDTNCSGKIDLGDMLIVRDSLNQTCPSQCP